MTKQKILRTTAVIRGLPIPGPRVNLRDDDDELHGQGSDDIVVVSSFTLLIHLMIILVLVGKTE